MKENLLVDALAGIRALDHCIEQQYRAEASPPVRALAREGAGILFQALRASHRDEESADARQRALIGAWMSLWSDEGIVALGPSHSIGYQLGAPSVMIDQLIEICAFSPLQIWNSSRDLFLFDTGGDRRYSGELSTGGGSETIGLALALHRTESVDRIGFGT